MSSSNSIQVTPLPLSSGGASSQTQKEMEKTNTTLTMLLAQSTADSTFDPPPPSTITSSHISEAFSPASVLSPAPYGDDCPYIILSIAVLFMVYGCLSK